MAKTPISKPAAKPAARPTPTDRLVEAHEKISALAAENASLKAAAGPAGQRPTTAPGSAPMAPRVPPASTKPGMIEAGVAAALLLFGILAGLAISPQINWGKVVQAPTKVEQPAAPTEEKKTSAEQPAKLADRLDQPVEEPVKVREGEEPILLPPAEKQVVEDNQQLLVDLKTRCKGLVDRIPVGKMSAEELNQLMNWCDSARQTPPQQVEEQPAEEQQKQLAGNYQPQAEGLTETDSTALKGLLDKMHGPAPAGFMYQGYETRQGYRPKPNGCTEHKVHDKKLRRTFIRVICG